MKKIFVIICTLCVFLTACNKKNSIPDESEYVDLPNYRKFLNFRTNYFDDVVLININSDNYCIFCGSGSPFLYGAIHYTKDSKLVFDYPNNVNFMGSDVSPEVKQKVLDYFFPNKQKCVFNYEPELKVYYGKGFYTYKDLVFSDDKVTEKLSIGDNSIIEGIPVTLERQFFTPKSTALIYEKPSFKSKTIRLTRINWKFLNDKENVRIDILKDDIAIPAIYGLRFIADAKTQKEFKGKKEKDFWYYVQISDYKNRGEERYGWMFGGDLIPYYVENGIPANNDYNQKILEYGKENKIVEEIEIDLELLPKQMRYIGIGEDDGTEIYFNDEIIYLFNNLKHEYATIDRKKMFNDKDGFTKIDLTKKTFLFIDGKAISQYFTNFQNDGKNYYTDADKDEPYRYHSEYFKSISASSFYSETTNGRFVEYKPENLYKCFEHGCKCHPYWWNYEHIPWVEGVEGNGIGEKITIEFTENMSGMSILNGYTDINNLKLYKENSRVKQLLVEDLVNNITQTMDFEDYVYFNYIEFKKPTTKVRITIKDVYEGTKYKDTCISAILPSKEKLDLNKEYIQNSFKQDYKESKEKTAKEVIDSFF